VLRGVLPLVPFATRDLPPKSRIEAQLPIRVSSKAASNSMTISATLARADGSTVQLAHANVVAAEYAKSSGKVYRVGIPPGLAAGAYRLVVDTTLGRAQISREVAFRIAAQ
jgi:hypothetical protein